MDKTIADLPAATSLVAADLIPLSQAGQTKQAPFSLVGGEYGSNANGEYVRWQNGLQVCWFVDSVTQGTSTEITPSNFAGPEITYTFPAAFISTPAIMPAGQDGGGGYSWDSQERTMSSTSVTLRAFGVNGSQTRYLGYVAIGRWK